MERKIGRPRPGIDSEVDNNPQKQQTTPRMNDDSAASPILQRPGTHSEFYGTGFQHSGSGDFTARDVYIGSTSGGGLERKFLRDLRLSDPRDDKKRIERTKGGLLRDSFRWILDHDDFRRWQDDRQSRVLWVKGDPGKGKTMLLCGIITEMERQPVDAVLSYFFCQETDARLNNATAVLRGLIYLLLDQQPSLIERLRIKYDHARKQLFEDVNNWDALSKMLIFILQDPGSQTTYLVIDALDECKTGLSQLLQLIVQVSSTSQAKWLLSSRNRRDIEQVIRPKESQTRLSLELKENAELVSRAVNAYISRCISQLTVLEGNTLLQEQIRSKIQQKADGTFLWVSLVIKELREAEVWEVMNIINDIPAGLDELYQRMIRQIQRQGRDRPKCCWKLLSTVTVAYRPLHLEELRVLVDLPPSVPSTQQNIAAIAGWSGSFLTIRDDVIYIIHQSAKDFLVNYIAQFSSGLAAVHNIIASQSIRAMSGTLKRDMYNIRKPGFPISRVKPLDPDPIASARYSCVYWVNHLAEGSNEDGQWGQVSHDSGPVHAFLEKHLLHWLEALSLLGNMSEGILQVLKLANLTQSSLENPKLTALVLDGLRFIRTNRAGIEVAPLQVYTSATIFCPKRSTIRKLFNYEKPRWVTIKPAVEDKWSGCLQTLEGHRGYVTSILFCSDTMQVVSGSTDSTVKIWDSATGQCIHTLLGHAGMVYSVALSSDNRQLASGLQNCTIKIWDSATGHCLKTLSGHTDRVYSVAFSSSSAQLVSASSDETIKIWDVTTGHCLQTLRGHTKPVRSVALSGDNRHLASGSYDCTVKIWDSITGSCLKTLSGHSDWITSIAFSGDGIQLASASNDKSIKIWDRSVGRCLQTLKGHTLAVNSVIFSGDGMQLVSASRYGTIKIWDRSTGQCVQTLTGHTGSVSSVAFTGNNNNNMQLVSASSDYTVKIWDRDAGHCPQTPRRPIGTFRSIAFSGDNTQLVTASDNKTVMIWDTKGRPLKTLKRHTKAVSSATFLANGKKLVSASDDNTVVIWDTATGRHLKTLEGHRGPVGSVTVTGNYIQLVLALHANQKILITDRAIGRRVKTRKGQRDHQSTHSSVDSILLASTSGDKTIKIWDIATGQCLRTLQGHTGWVYSAAFSSDGTQLASTSEDRTVKVWDVATGQCLQTLRGHLWPALSVAFSNDSTQLASASAFDGTVRIWDRSTGQCHQMFKLDRALGRISFSETDLQLHTDIGTIDLRAGAVDVATFCGYAINSNNGWITRDSENVLWLPPEYRPTCVAVRGSTVALGCSRGRVVVLRFSEDGAIL